MTLSQDHRDYLLAAAIRPEVIDSSGIHTREEAPRGIVFPWNDGTLEEPLPQLRPDVATPDKDGRPVKYRFPKDSSLVLNRLRDSGEGPALIIEGTKQQYAGLSHAPESFAVYGLSGCWGWVNADLSWADGREVFILFDGDFTSNKDVHQAASELAEQLELSGAESIKYIRTTARGTDGLDDVLARLPEAKRAPALELWISKALAKLPKAPAKKSSSPFFDKSDGFQVQKATNHLLENQPAALTAERRVALYLNGVYHIDGTAFLSAVTEQLGDQFRPAWRAAMEEMTVGKLFAAGKLLPEQNPYTKLNCTNGMLDLKTLELEPHSPEFMSTVQVGVDWVPDAKAPTYEAWLGDVCPLQAEDLEEVVATMLDPTRTPHKAAFLFGPSRSGKSTMLRLLQAIAGVENRTAVTLHDLSRDRFAAANVYGKMLNSAADLSSAHVEDLSSFKMMTGEDPIHANRKYGTQFTFTNQALFAFSANELPTVTESSRAYAERIKPFEFPHSYAGRENPAIEQRMLRDELPGILVRWVHAYRRVLDRGGYQKTDERVRREFETRSDRVAQWIADVCTITPVSGPGATLPDHQCTGRRETARAFNTWAERNGGHKMGERKVFDRLGHMSGIYEVRSGRSKQRAFNLVVKDDPNADLGFSPQPPVERVEVVAEVAVSEHPSHVTSHSAPGTEVNDLEGGDEKVHGKGASKVPLLPPARSAVGHNGINAVTDGTAEWRSSFAVLGFDLETADADKLFTGGHEGDFVRLLGGVTEHGIQGTDYNDVELIQDLNRADVIYGHNILGFDLLALAHHHGADYDALAAKAVDTQVLAKLADPPLSKGMPNGYYGLDQVAQRIGHEGKTDDLKALAKKHGGFDRIPLDDAEYHAYLRGDLAASKHVFDAGIPEGRKDYAEREMKIVALQNRMTLNGWAVDRDLLAQRVVQEGAKRAQAIQELHERYGVPLAKPDRFKLKPKKEWPERRQGLTAAAARAAMIEDPGMAEHLGLAVRIPGEVYASPWATDAGREAIEEAFAQCGVKYLPRTKSGQMAMSSDALGDKPWFDAHKAKSVPGLLQVYGDNPEARALVETLLLATGARAKYAEVAKYVTGTGRVHGFIGAAQGSGRWAQSPFTTMGSRGAAAAERDVMVADEGHVLITCDLSQVDLRAMAALSQDPAYMEIMQPGRDAHSEMALIYFGELTPETRQKTKAFNHAGNYGQGPKAVSERTGIPLDKCYEIRDAKAEAYPRLTEYIEEVRETAASGQLLDNGFGRLMRPDPERAYTQGPALMGQGAARDIMCESLLRLVALADERGQNVRPHLRAVVHDELVLSVPELEWSWWSQLLAEAFTWEWRGVPILCEVSNPAKRWSDCAH